eukprot:scaffold285_cov330-Pavlova_lutheri.AAC.128
MGNAERSSSHTWMIRSIHVWFKGRTGSRPTARKKQSVVWAARPTCIPWRRFERLGALSHRLVTRTDAFLRPASPFSPCDSKKRGGSRSTPWFHGPDPPFLFPG